MTAAIDSYVQSGDETTIRTAKIIFYFVQIIRIYTVCVNSLFPMEIRRWRYGGGDTEVEIRRWRRGPIYDKGVTKFTQVEVRK